ncbi:MAG: hypothetical protein OXT72_11870 [Gammaproteobacteria bacterium]|nr:hypothetical protein [Gammaproteobacteria bacterium]MDE0249057.1 hypothetical protein [Gammaproteobacteria bacterium]
MDAPKWANADLDFLVRRGDYERARDTIAKLAAAFHGRAGTYGLSTCGGGTAAKMSDQPIEERRRTLWLQAHRMGDMVQYGIPFRTGEDHKGGAPAGATCQRLPFPEL